MNVVNHLLAFVLTFCLAPLFALGSWERRHRNLSLAELEDGCTVAPQLTFQGLSTVLQDVPTIQDMLRCRCALANPIFKFQRAVTSDDFNVWVLPKPRGQGARTSIWQQIDGPTGFEIHNNRAIDMAPPEREIIHTDDLGDRVHHRGEKPCCTQHGGRADPTLHPGQQCRPRIATEHDRDLLDGRNLPPTATTVSPQPIDEALTKDLSTAQRLLTHEAANGQFQRDGSAARRKITQMTTVAAVNSGAAGATLRTGRSRLGAGGHH